MISRRLTIKVERRIAMVVASVLVSLSMVWLSGNALAKLHDAPALGRTAVVFTVNSSDDSAICDNATCTLRGAILAANAAAGADTIVFALADDSAINLTAALPAISDPLTIDGSTASGLVVSGAATYRILEVASNTSVTVTDLALVDGSGNLNGGAVLANSASQLSIAGCTFTSNAASNRGGAILNDGGTITITNSHFTTNTATNRGGAIYNDGGQLTVNASTFHTNTTGTGGDGGGAIYNSGVVAIANSVFSSNAVASGNGGGGALFNDGSGLATVTGSTFTANTVVDGGGAIRNSGALTLTGSTLATNTATGVDSAGGGILNNTSGTVLLANSTLYGNSADSGGGMRNSGILTMVNATVSGNAADAGSGGGLFNSGLGTLNYTNSILANSPSGGDCRNDGTIAVHVQNLVESGACSQDIMADPLLGPLLDNGGPTDTQALLMGSPAINAADNSACVADPVNGTDQRGVIRPQADACDIGAYEVEAIAGLTAESDSPTGLGEPTTFTATVTAGESVAYAWNFGDSTIGAGATTKHTYALTGSYQVTATATNAANQMTTTLLVQVIAPVTGLVAENDGPTALGESTHFTATVAGGSDVTYFWDFGDSQSGAGPTPSHTYAAVGTYTAVVTASNVLGSATASTEVIVAEAIAGLTANSNSPTLLGNATTFTATITAGSDVTYTWDFGDSQSGAGAIITHTYTTAGIYAVSVVATNALGSQTVTIAVEVIELSYLIHLPAVWNP